MCTALEEMIKEGEQRGMEQGIEQGIEQGRDETTAYVVQNMYRKGFGVEKIAETLSWPLERVKKYII